MKHRVLAVIILCLGIVMLLWEYVLYEGENYRITQSAFGGKMTVFNYEEVFSFPAPDNLIRGVSGQNMDEIVNKVLSGNISWNEMYFTAREPEMRFGGLLQIYIPVLPEGCFLREKGHGNVFWNPAECGFEFTGTISGQISYCEKNCVFCEKYNAQWERAINEGRTDVQLCELDGARAMEFYGFYLWGEDNGVSYHATLNCRLKDVTEEQLASFSMRRYEPRHPTLLYVRMLQHFGVIMILAGAAILLHSFMKTKAAKAE